MIPWKCVLGGVALGAAVGVWAGRSDSHRGEWFVSFDPQKPRLGVTSVEEGPRAFVVNHPHYSFGRMAQGEKRKHNFVIRNVGTEPLRLVKGETSCLCTSVAFETPAASAAEQATLAPGDELNVWVEWKASTSAFNFFQTAKIETNDPTHPTVELRIDGEVTEQISVSPTAIRFSNASPDAPSSSGFYVLSAEPMPPDVRIEFLGAGTAELFSAAVRPMTPEEIEQRRPAASGHFVEVTMQPGIVAGQIQQTARVHIGAPGLGPIDVQIYGKVASDVSLVGPAEYSASREWIDWGLLRRDQRRETRLLLLFKGPHRRQAKLSVAQVTPGNALEVEIGELKNPDADVHTYPVIVRLKPDAPTMDRLGLEGDRGMGEVVLNTGHPATPQVRFHVKFAVE